MIYSHGLSAEEIAHEKSMTLPQVFTALTYYLANRDEIDRVVDEYERAADERAARWPTSRRS